MRKVSEAVPVGTAAQSKRSLANDLRSQLVIVYFDFCFFCIDIDGNGLGSGFAAIEHCQQMVPGPRFERIFRSHFQCFVRPLIDNVNGGPPVSQEKIPATVSLRFVHAGKNGATWFVFNHHERAIAGLAIPLQRRRSLFQGDRSGHKRSLTKRPRFAFSCAVPGDGFAMRRALEMPICR